MEFLNTDEIIINFLKVEIYKRKRSLVKIKNIFKDGKVNKKRHIRYVLN